MHSFVSLDEAYAHLRIDQYCDDLWLEIFIPAISQSVASWVKDAWRLYAPMLDSDGQTVLDSDGHPVPAEDDDGNPILKYAVRAAVLIELERQYRCRGGESPADVPSTDGGGYVLGKGATALLAPLRKSTAA